MSKSDRKFFLCTGQAVTAEQLPNYPSSHVIGDLCYKTDEGRKVTALARWDVSISTQDELPARPEIDVYLIGDARDIKCRYPGCDHKNRWEIGKAAFLQLMHRYPRFNPNDV